MHSGSVTIKAGKGDDIVNETVFDEDAGQFGIYRQYFQDDGPAFTTNVVGDGEEFLATYGEESNELEKFYGEQGDDKIWLGGNINTRGWAHGGSGDDTLYGGY